MSCETDNPSVETRSVSVTPAPHEAEYYHPALEEDYAATPLEETLDRSALLWTPFATHHSMDLVEDVVTPPDPLCQLTRDWLAKWLPLLAAWTAGRGVEQRSAYTTWAAYTGETLVNDILASPGAWWRIAGDPASEVLG